MASGARRAFFAGLLDYAGLFPPAQLAPDVVRENYEHYRGGANAWFLGRLLSPAAKVTEFAGLSPIGVVGRAADDVATYYKNLREDAQVLSQHKEAVVSFEIKLPTRVFQPPRKNQIAALVSATPFILESAGVTGLQIYFECPVPDLAAWTALAEVLLAEQKAFGLKIRCGGAEVPTTELLAGVVKLCAATGLLFKATAGLHHALRHDGGHGFVNLFAAGLLARVHPLNMTELAEILEQRTPLGFDDDALIWRNYRVSEEQIRAGRAQFGSFGSCSFEEPWADAQPISEPEA